MKTKTTVLLCIGFLMITALGCGNRTDAAGADTVNATALVASVMSGADEAVLQKAVDAANEVINAAAEERISLSWDEFRDKVLNDCDYDISEEELQVLYQDIKDSKILKGENRQLTGLALNDYDQNGQTDMIVSVVYDEKGGAYTDGCIYLFMNSKKLYYMHDEYCCYKTGDIFCDFGADIDHDQNIEVVFCVGGTKIDCVKFVVKPMDKGIKRMELPHGLFTKDDYGENLWVAKGLEEGVYEVCNWSFAEKVTLKTGEQKEKYDWSSSGYYKLALAEYQGEELLAGYEYIYLGDAVLGSAVFMFDWDENGKAYVKAWYVEDNEGKTHVPFGKIQESAFDYTHIFDENETGEEVKAYEGFITGKMAAYIDDNICMDTSDIGKVMDKDGQGFYFESLIDEIIKETMDGWYNGIWAVQYALIDCGSDGKKQLALRAYGLGIEGACDDSTCTMVFDYKDGKIFMLYAVKAWSRGRTDLYKNGYVYGEGSGGAACSYTWERFIGADGVCHESFDCHTEYGQEWYGSGMSSWYSWEGNEGIIDYVYFSEYSINGETVYSYNIWDDADITDKDRQVIRDYIQHNESLIGVDFLTGDEMEELLAETRKNLGITEGMDAEENKIEWRVLPRLTSLSQ